MSVSHLRLGIQSSPTIVIIIIITFSSSSVYHQSNYGYRQISQVYEEEEEVEEEPAHLTRSNKSQRLGRTIQNAPSPTFNRKPRLEMSPQSSRRAPSRRRSHNTMNKLVSKLL